MKLTARGASVEARQLIPVFYGQAEVPERTDGPREWAGGAASLGRERMLASWALVAAPGVTSLAWERPRAAPPCLEPR